MSEEGSERLLQEVRRLRQRVNQLERKLEALTRAGPPVEEDRVKTFVDAFDDALGGGVPTGHVVILHGPTGTMKTSLSLYLASRNRAKGMRTLYISLEEDRESLLRTMEGLGMKEEDFIVDIATMRLEHGMVEEAGDWLHILLSYLQRKLEGGLDILVIDAFNSIYNMTQPQLLRRELFQFFSFLRDSQLTSFLIYEGKDFPYREDYMADGVLEITPRDLDRGQVALWMRCVKLRHTAHSRDYHRLEFRRDRFVALPVTH